MNPAAAGWPTQGINRALLDWLAGACPRGARRPSFPEDKEDPMRRYRTLALGAAMLALVMSACSPGGSGSSSEQASTSQTASKPDVSVGSADFYEAAVVGEMYAQALEA